MSAHYSPKASSRIILPPMVNVEKAISLLKKHCISVAGGGYISRSEAAVGVIVFNGDPTEALEILAKAGIEATAG